MQDYVEEEYADTLEVSGDAKSSARVLAALAKAERCMNGWQGTCDRIDDVYSRFETDNINWLDAEYDLFWASMEIMKPAVYAKPPHPVVSPKFKDRRRLQNVTAELLERTIISTFDRGDIDEAMIGCRDDLIFYGRGAPWLTYETDEKGGGQRVCIEHLDRKDFLHPPARKWSEVPWVARRAWMTKREMRKRFRKPSGDAYMNAITSKPEGDEEGADNHSRKIGVWEVWHKADNRVYWVAEGVGIMLDESDPHLKLSGFFPCPRPAYGTLRARTLIPVPDYLRYEGHFNKINQLTRRIYKLLDMVRMKGLIPSGGDVANAVQQLVAENDDVSLLIPVPEAALISGSTGNYVQWLPLAEIATAIQGLIEARRELFGDFDRLSGISDIMRGETEAEETLGAQRLKSQYGSVRVREKIDELQRLACDITQIAAEIMAENFSKDTLLDMSQMEIPTKAELDKATKEVEKRAKEDLAEVRQEATKVAQQAQATGQQIDPQQAQQQIQQASQQIVQRAGSELQKLSEQVPLEDVVKLLRDDKARNFAFEIATDSTILTDEMQEKANRNEFLTVFSGATQGLVGIAQLGPAGAKLAGEVLKFVLQPYRVGRELNGVIDEFIDAAPEMAAAAGQNGNQEAEKAIAEANQKLADAELQKAQAAIAKVQADAQGKMQDMQLKATEAAAKADADQKRLQLELAETKGTIAETGARIEKIQAEIQKLGIDASNQTRQQNREDFKTAADVEMRATDQAMAQQQGAQDAAFRAQDGQRADRQQGFSERQGERADERADRQQSLAERQATEEA